MCLVNLAISFILTFQLAGMKEKMDSITNHISQILSDRVMQQDGWDHSWTKLEGVTIGGLLNQLFQLELKWWNDASTPTLEEALVHFVQTLSMDSRTTFY